MERKDLPMITPAEESAPSSGTRLKLQAQRRDPAEMTAQPRGREAAPTARIDIEKPAADVDGSIETVVPHLEKAAREIPRLVRERDEARARASAHEQEAAALKSLAASHQQSAAELKEARAKLDDARQVQSALQIENGNLKTKVNELEAQLKKRETALHNAKEEKEVLERKLTQIKSALGQ